MTIFDLPYGSSAWSISGTPGMPIIAESTARIIGVSRDGITSLA